MIINVGWINLILIWMSGELAGRAVASIYAGEKVWIVSAFLSSILLAGVSINIKFYR